LNEKNSEETQGRQGVESPRGARNEALTPAEEENGYLSDGKQADVQVEPLTVIYLIYNDSGN
jgi:hypothetical protein